MKYLVTGGEGYVGRYVALWLIEQGHDVVLTTRRGTTQVPGAEVINLDILNSDKSVFETVGRPDILIHLASRMVLVMQATNILKICPPHQLHPEHAGRWIEARRRSRHHA